MNIKIIDCEFQHVSTFNNGKLNINPIHFNWYRGNEYTDITIFTDRCLHYVFDINSNIKIAWIIESIFPAYIDWIKNNYNSFDYILTNNRELLTISNKFIWIPFGGCWIDEQYRKIYEKCKNISIIASNKNVFSGHILRHKVIETFKNQLDFICGNGYLAITDKLEGLKDFRYSVIIENIKKDGYFTEKLIDCCITGTIPIYWGCDDIETYGFNVIKFENIEELNNILKYCDKKYYINNINIIENNFEIAKKYVMTEDWIWNNLLKRLV